MPGECVGAAEGLLHSAKIALDLVLSLVVDSVFVASQIVWAREDGTARLACAGVDAIATMRASLTVQHGRRHTVVLWPQGSKIL